MKLLWHCLLPLCIATVAGPVVAAAPVATAQATSSPSLIDNDSVSGAGKTALASVANDSRAAQAIGGTSGLMSTESSANGPGLANLTAAHAGVRLSLFMEGPAGVSLTGSLVTEASGSGTVTSELGNRGSMAVASFHYRFQTAGDTSTGSIQWVSQAGFSTAKRVGGSALIGDVSVTPLFSVQLETPGGSVTFSPAEDDWLRWGLPKPQASLYPIESIALMSDAHAASIANIKRAIDLYGLFDGTYDPATTKVSVGVDVAYSFEAMAGVDLSMRSGRNDVLIASIGSQSNSTAGGSSEAKATGFAGGPMARNLPPMRLVVASDTPYDLSQFRLRIDGTDVAIPIELASPVPELSTYQLWFLGVGFVAGVRTLRGWRRSRRVHPDQECLSHRAGTETESVRDQTAGHQFG